MGRNFLLKIKIIKYDIFRANKKCILNLWEEIFSQDKNYIFLLLVRKNKNLI